MLYTHRISNIYTRTYTYIYMTVIDLPSGEQVLAVDHEADLRGPQRP